MAEDTRRNRTHRNALAPGYRLHWYEIDSILGQGGFGITYLARDTNLDQLVAIKEFLPQELAVREGDSSVQPVTDGHSDTFGWGLSRFLTEARTLAKFRHPNIVLVHSVFEANNTAYMVMEYEHGRSLEDALKFRKVEGEAQLRAMVYPLLEGLELMHLAGFIHRDIKPQNIFIREDSTPVLLDFGSARLALGGQTRTLTTLVSPGYAPFEQYETSREGGRQGPWTDIYSLGATLYMAVTGHGPPDAVTRANARLDGRPDPLVPARVAAGPGFTPAFLYAIDSALAFQAADRPKNVAQWRHLLEATEAPQEDDATVVRGQPLPPPVARPLPDTSPHASGPSTGEATADSRRQGAPPSRHRPTAPPPEEAAPAKRSHLPMIALVLVALAVVGAGTWVANRYLADGSLPFVTRTDPPAPVAPEQPESTTDATSERQAREEAAMTQLQGGGSAPAPAPPAPPAPDIGGSGAQPQPQTSPEQARVDDLLRRAAQDLQAGRLVEPTDDSALHRYRTVLGLQPDNTAALEGMERIITTLVTGAQQRLAAGDLDAAEDQLLSAEMVAPEAPLVVRVRERLSDTRATLEAMREAEQALAEQAARAAAEAERQVEEQAARERAAAEAAARAEAERQAEEQARRRAEAEAQRREEAEARQRAEAEARREAAERQQAGSESGQSRVEQLLAAAEQDLRATRLTSPAGENALEKYDEVLRLDPGNSAARTGKQRIVERYLELADTAVNAGRTSQARSYLERADGVMPGSELIAAARSRLAPPAPEPAPAPVQPAQPAQPAQPSQPAPQPAAPSRPALRNPAHVAILPVETKRNCFEPDDKWVRDAASRAVSESRDLRLTYDAYAETGARGLMDRVWQGSLVDRVPNKDEVLRLARARDIDVVFLAFIDCGHRPAANKSRFPFTFWVFDVDTGETLVSEGRLNTIVTSARELFAAVVSARRGAGG